MRPRAWRRTENLRVPSSFAKRMVGRFGGDIDLADSSDAETTDAARFAAIVACSSDAIISKSLDGIIQTWNPAAEALFGWSAQEIIGHPINRIIPAELAHEEEQILARIREGNVVPKFRTVRVAKDGTRIPIGVTVSPVRDKYGAIVGASKIANDLRDQERLVSGLREKTDQFTALANNIPQLAWMADEKGWIFWYNQQWYDYTGTSSEDMEGWGWKAVHHPDHVDRVGERIQHAWDTGEPWEDTFPLKRHDGTFRWFLSRANPLKDESGRIVLWCGSNTDITDELEAKTRIEILMREVSHRSRNMLAILQAMLNRSRRKSGEDLADSLTRRIAALKSNQEILDGGDWTGARIIDVVRHQVEHVGERLRERIDISGPDDLILGTRHAETLGLAIHELATNAEKYGALSNDTGRVQVAWKLSEQDTPAPALEISWTERGGPAVSPPVSTGFGSLLIRQNIEGVFQGTVTVDYGQSGLVWSCTCAAQNCLVDGIDRLDANSYIV